MDTARSTAIKSSAESDESGEAKPKIKMQLPPHAKLRNNKLDSKLASDRSRTKPICEGLWVDIKKFTCVKSNTESKDPGLACDRTEGVLSTKEKSATERQVT